MPTDFERLPQPRSPEEAMLAQSIGMVVIKAMADVHEMERFSGAVGEGIAEISDPNGEMWVLKVLRV